MALQDKTREELVAELHSHMEELGRQNMILLGCRLKIVELQREIKNLKERLSIYHDLPVLH